MGFGEWIAGQGNELRLLSDHDIGRWTSEPTDRTGSLNSITAYKCAALPAVVNASTRYRFIVSDRLDAIDDNSIAFYSKERRTTQTDTAAMVQQLIHAPNRENKQNV